MSTSLTRVALAAVLFAAVLPAQSPPPPVSGSAGLELMLRRLETTGVVMITNAHPDDENNPLIAMIAHGLGARVVEVTATRGEGGQNDLGPEQGLPLSILRTEELLATHRIDGAEQLFARAVDFGYSFSVDETYAKWGKDEILADFVRLIRTVQPDVIVSMAPDGGGGGQHHQASARITREAFDAAADPKRFPEQIEETLEPWQATRLYIPLAAPPPDEPASRPNGSRPTESRRAESAPAPMPGDLAIDLDAFDPALGATYAEVGTRARGMHKSQGMARLGALPGPLVARYRIAAGAVPHPSTDTPKPAHGGLFDGIPTAVPDSLLESVREARAALAQHGPAAAVAPLVAGLKAVRKTLASLDGPRKSDRAAFEIHRRLLFKESQLVEAIGIAAGLRFEAIADAGVVVPGQEVGVTVYLANRLAAGLEFGRIAFEGFDPDAGGCATRPSAPLPPQGLVKCESKLRIPAEARITTAHWKPIAGTSRSEWDPDVPFGAPFRPTPFRASAQALVGGEPVVFETAVEFRDGSDPFAWEKRHEILVTPPGAADVQVIEYPHVRRRHLWPAPPAQAGPISIPFELAKPVTVGSIPGPCDRIDEAITRLGASVLLLDEHALRFGPSVQECPVIVIGSRAFELRPEVRRVSGKLLEYVEKGGTLVILYQRSGLDEACGAPKASKTGANRVTDEAAPVKLLVPDHPIFTTPNKLTEADWGGWIQERGRSFLETTDSRYIDLVEIEDPFELNKGAKRGILVEARVGKGRWIYCGLALSRQLEAGVPGAYRLFANMLSLRGG